MKETWQLRRRHNIRGHGKTSFKDKAAAGCLDIRPDRSRRSCGGNWRGEKRQKKAVQRERYAYNAERRTALFQGGKGIRSQTESENSPPNGGRKEKKVASLLAMVEIGSKEKKQLYLDKRLTAGRLGTGVPQ